MSGLRSIADGPFDDVDSLKRLHECPEIFERLLTLEGNELSIQRQLRAEFADDLVRGALLLRDLRKRAAAKFSRPAAMWFDRTGLEQSTSEPVARHKAARFPAGVAVADLCSGIGADSLALAENHHVTAVDTREAAGLMAAWNASAYGVGENLATHVGMVEGIALDGRPFHIDPDRRPGGQRSLRIEDHQPGLEFLQALASHPAGGAIKLSPASNFGGKFPGCEIELISIGGECKEAVVWCGPLRTDTDWRATVLSSDSSRSADSLAGDPWQAVSEQSPLGRYLYDPDPAVVRAGLVDVLCERIGLKRLDREEEYLTADEPIASAFVQQFEVLALLSNNDRDIRNWFRQANCGQVEIKCRRIPVTPEKVRKHLPLDGKDALVLIFARIAGRSHAVACRRVEKRPTEMP